MNCLPPHLKCRKNFLYHLRQSSVSLQQDTSFDIQQNTPNIEEKMEYQSARYNTYNLIKFSFVLETNHRQTTKLNVNQWSRIIRIKHNLNLSEPWLTIKKATAIALQRYRNEEKQKKEPGTGQETNFQTIQQATTEKVGINYQSLHKS